MDQVSLIELPDWHPIIQPRRGSSDPFASHRQQERDDHDEYSGHRDNRRARSRPNAKKADRPDERQQPDKAESKTKVNQDGVSHYP